MKKLIEASIRFKPNLLIQGLGFFILLTCSGITAHGQSLLQIIQQPQDQVADYGSYAFFTIKVSGTDAFTTQWQSCPPEKSCGSSSPSWKNLPVAISPLAPTAYIFRFLSS